MTAGPLVVLIGCWIWFTLVRAESFLLTPHRNLQSFNSLILGNVPLFQTETILTAPEIILHPNASEIDKMCVHCVRNCVEITKVRAEVSGLFHRRLVVTGGWARQLVTARYRGGEDTRSTSILCPESFSFFPLLLCNL